MRVMLCKQPQNAHNLLFSLDNKHLEGKNQASHILCSWNSSWERYAFKMFTSIIKVIHPHYGQICVVSFYLPLHSLGPACSSTKKKKKIVPWIYFAVSNARKSKKNEANK